MQHQQQQQQAVSSGSFMYEDPRYDFETVNEWDGLPEEVVMEEETLASPTMQEDEPEHDSHPRRT